MLNGDMRTIALTGFFLAFALILSEMGVSGISSCNFLCGMKPTVLDYRYPTGCYCHSTCGGKLRCCADKNIYCGSGFRRVGGSQACLIPKTVRNSKIVGGQKAHYSVGDTITYKCNFRYLIEGSATIECYGADIWRPPPPRCEYEPFACRPPNIDNGRVADSKEMYLNGETVEVVCDRGYQIRGFNSRMTCRYSSWRDRPSCRRIPCNGECDVSTETCNDPLGYKWSSYECECKTGYIRSIRGCIVDPCTNNNCHMHATCSARGSNFDCDCEDGYIGNGISCRLPCNGECDDSTEDCVDPQDESGSYKCECKPGLIRIGDRCVVDPCIDNECHMHATCIPEGFTDYVCECDVGYEGNGTFCIVDPCVGNHCHRSSRCSSDWTTNSYSCLCLTTFSSSNISRPIASWPCDPDRCYALGCHPNATCAKSDNTPPYKCECDNGFVGNGTQCEPSEQACNPSEVYGEEIVVPCEECKDVCCNSTAIRECRICIHTKCNQGEVCGEGMSRVETVCSKEPCNKNQSGYTVDAPDYVHCLDEKGVHKSDTSCCWSGE